MNLNIISWEAKGLRCPDGIINLKSNGKFKEFNLIQMPNYTGKTSYKELIQASLSGSLENKSSKDIWKYRDKDNFKENGFFKLEIESDGQNIIFEISFNFEDEETSKVKYTTTYPNEGGLQNGHKPPIKFKKLFDEDFVKLFVFDGEMANDLLDSSKNKAYECIDSLCQLNIFDKIQNTLEKYYEDRLQKESTKAKTDVAITKQLNKIKVLKDRIKNIEDKKYENENEFKNNEKEIKRLQDDISHDDSLEKKFRDDLNQKKDILKNLENQIKIDSKNFLNTIRNPIYLSTKTTLSLKIFRESLNRMKIPAHVTKSFFEELIEEANCICNREMNSDSKKAIEENKQKYFDHDQSGVYNHIKSEINDALESKDFDQNLIENLKENFKKLLDNKEKASTDVEISESNLAKNSNEDVRKKIEKRKELELRQKEILKENNKYEEPDDNKNYENTNSLKKLKDELKISEHQLEQVQENRDLTKVKKIIEDLCKNSKLESKLMIKKSIIDKCNNKLLEVLKAKNPLQIDDIEGSINLKGQEGASEGQKLATGIIYLSTLLSRENYKLPTIFDSPCGAIDLHVRKDLADAITNIVQGQFITFVQGSERRFFTEVFEDEVADDKIYHLTVLKKDRFSKEEIPDIPANAFESNDSYFIEDKNFFNNFNPKRESKNV